MDKRKLEYPFEVRIEDEGEALFYVLRYKDFENVIGVGETMEEALAVGKEALEAELAFLAEQGKPAPKPTVTNPLTDVSGRVTLRMPKTLHRKLILRSEEERVSLNTTILAALSEYLASDKKSEDEYFERHYFGPKKTQTIPNEAVLAELNDWFRGQLGGQEIENQTYSASNARA